VSARGIHPSHKRTLGASWRGATAPDSRAKTIRQTAARDRALRVGQAQPADPGQPSPGHTARDPSTGARDGGQGDDGEIVVVMLRLDPILVAGVDGSHTAAHPWPTHLHELMA